MNKLCSGSVHSFADIRGWLQVTTHFSVPIIIFVFVSHISIYHFIFEKSAVQQQICHSSAKRLVGLGYFKYPSTCTNHVLVYSKAMAIFIRISIQTDKVFSDDHFYDLIQ